MLHSGNRTVRFEWGASKVRTAALAGVLALGTALPAPAEFRPEDLIGLGIQMLGQTQGTQNQPARQPAQQPARRQQAAPQRTPATQAKPAQVRSPSIPRSDAVAEAQRILNALGYDAGSVDGQAGPQTRRAIAGFQRDHGLPQTGETDASLLSVLRSRTAGIAASGTVPGGAGAGHSGSPAAAGQAGLAVAAAQAGGWQTLPGIDLPGGDYRSGLSDPRLGGTGVDGCAQLCASDAICRGFTYNTRADICILKDRVLRQEGFADAVSGIKGGAGPAAPAATAAAFATGTDPATAAAVTPAAPPTYADFVHMALMSDAGAYAAEASALGVPYLLAVGTDEQCKAALQAERSDEFTRRDFAETAAALLRDALANLADRPSRVEVPVEQTYYLSEYDFDRQGFALPLGNSSGTPLLTPGVVRLKTDDRTRRSCNSGGYGEFGNLGAEHGGAPGIDFLPMSPESARAFRASGRSSVMIRAIMAVEPRDQGRGPLKGQIIAVSAHDPEDGRVLHRWDVAARDPAGAAAGSGPEWSGDLLASLIAPVFEPFLDPDALDRAAIGYFSQYEGAINSGNPPPQSPLPIEAMRGQQPEVIVSRYRDRLREVLREAGPELPLTVRIEQQVTPWHEEGIGLQFNAIETGLMTTAVEDPLAEIALSDRDLQLHDALLPRSLSRGRDQGFKATVIGWSAPRIQMEFDRVIRLDTIPLSIEEAAARGMVGNAGTRDSVVLHWTLDLTEVRGNKDEIIVSAAVKGLSYRWASDGTLLREVPAAEFTTVAALRGEADAALGPVASAGNIQTPPDGTLWGAEMTDLLRLRHAPDTVDDKTIERMMITRFDYEARLKDSSPLWGRFFRKVDSAPTAEDRQARLAEFRAWSEARAAALPGRLTLRLPLHDDNMGKVSPFRNTGIQLYGCNNVPEADPKTASESELAESKLCAYLNAARTAPEPLLVLRGRCIDDPYCQSLNNAWSQVQIPDRLREPEMVRFDRLPVFDDAARAKAGTLLLELEVEVTGGSAEAAYPTTTWQQALATAQGFAESYSLQVPSPERTEAPGAPVMLFTAKAVAARLVDAEREVAVHDLVLDTPAPPPADMLAMPESEIAKRDLLGIRLGMGFDEADRLIREHMEVGKVLTADRSTQLSAATGKLVAYSSGKIYASAAGDELIGILDEPPAAAATVVGIWRILRLPAGTTNPVALKATLVERYGEPTKVEEIQLPFMKVGVGWYWLDVANERCRAIDFETQADLWRDETGSTAWLPAFMSQPRYPVLQHPSTFDGVTDEPLPPVSFCPAFLGVRFATYDGANQGEAAGDEIVTWLSDNRGYAKLFHEARQAPVEAALPDVAEGSRIKF